MPGGDTFRIAEEFGESGLAKLKEKVGEGMGYIGICAGAYLPLTSSISPLSSFNLLSAKIANISSELPEGIAEPERHTVRYGCSYVFHPARGPVELTGDRNLVAPIYGGPFLSHSRGETVRLRFSGTTSGTELSVDGRYYEEMSRGKAACIEGAYGRGRVLSISPHLEHPDYPRANDYLRDILLEFQPAGLPERACTDDYASARELRGAVADLRLLANALDSRSWKIGIKYWEGEKLLFYVEAVRKRILGHSADEIGTGDGIPMTALKEFERAREILRTEGDIGLSALDDAVTSLSTGASHFLNAHFSMLARKYG